MSLTRLIITLITLLLACTDRIDPRLIQNLALPIPNTKTPILPPNMLELLRSPSIPSSNFLTGSNNSVIGTSNTLVGDFNALIGRQNAVYLSRCLWSPFPLQRLFALIFLIVTLNKLVKLAKCFQPPFAVEKGLIVGFFKWANPGLFFVYFLSPLQSNNFTTN